MNKIAFDYGHTITHHPDLVELARSLRACGWSVYCITAVPENWTNELEQSRVVHITAMGLDGDLVRFVYHDLLGTHGTAYKAGLEKARVMRELGIPVLIDDDTDVCRGVRDSGLMALQV